MALLWGSQRVKPTPAAAGEFQAWSMSPAPSEPCLPLLPPRSQTAHVRFVALLLMLLVPSLAHANGRAPLTNGVFFRPADNDTIYVRSTFGMLISHDDGCTFRWVCEQNIGYGGTFDPKYAIATDGTIFATTFVGLRVSRDGGCSFTTATAELPLGAPNRIADIWVDALDIAPTGDVWVATAESGKTNNIYRSTDNGLTFEARGMITPMVLWKSLRVAPSDPMRVYASGYELGATPVAHFYSTIDGGQNWTPSPLTNVQFASVPVVVLAAVDAADPLVVYLTSVESNGMGDRLYRSSDGGTTFVEVLATTEAIRDVVIRDSTTVLVATTKGGLHRSGDGGKTFAVVAGSPELACLGKRPDGTLIGCGANWEPDFMSVARSDDATQWQKIFRFVEIAGPLACPAGTPNHDVCDQQMWLALKEQFGATGPTCGAAGDPTVEPPKSGGCCDAGAGSPLALGGLSMLATWMMLRRRRRR